MIILSLLGGAGWILTRPATVEKVDWAIAKVMSKHDATPPAPNPATASSTLPTDRRTEMPDATPNSMQESIRKHIEKRDGAWALFKSTRDYKSCASPQALARMLADIDEAIRTFDELSRVNMQAAGYNEPTNFGMLAEQARRDEIEIMDKLSVALQREKAARAPETREPKSAAEDRPAPAPESVEMLRVPFDRALQEVEGAQKSYDAASTREEKSERISGLARAEIRLARELKLLQSAWTDAQTELRKLENATPAPKALADAKATLLRRQEARDYAQGVMTAKKYCTATKLKKYEMQSADPILGENAVEVEGRVIILTDRGQQRTIEKSQMESVEEIR